MATCFFCASAWCQRWCHKGTTSIGSRGEKTLRRNTAARESRGAALRRRVSVLGSLENALANPSCKEKHGGWGGGVSKLTCLKRYFFFCPNHSVFLCHDIFIWPDLCQKDPEKVRFKIWSALHDLPFPIPSIMISIYWRPLGLGLDGFWVLVMSNVTARSRRLIKRV